MIEVSGGLVGYVIPFLIVLTVLVFVHEMGHYLIARKNGVRVEVFSIGFGPELFGRTDKAGTRWKFSLIPLGGYVKMFGDADAASRPDAEAEEMSPEDKAQAFPYKSLGQRAWIVAGGPLANFLFAIVLYAILYGTIGQPFTPPVIGGVVAGSAADQGGLLPGDRIDEIDGWAVNRFEDIQRRVAIAPGEPMDVVVSRDGQEIPLVLTPRVVEETDRFGRVNRFGQLGVTRAGLEFVHRDPFSAVWWAARETVSLTVMTLKVLGQMISGSRSPKELGGPLMIAQMSGQMAEAGLVPIILFTALLSINLGLINLFPVPMLDGGHLLFYAIEGIRGRPLGLRAQEYGFRIGLALVMSLMVFATWNDVVHHLRIPDFLSALGN